MRATGEGRGAQDGQHEAAGADEETRVFVRDAAGPAQPAQPAGDGRAGTFTRSRDAAGQQTFIRPRSLAAPHPERTDGVDEDTGPFDEDAGHTRAMRRPVARPPRRRRGLRVAGVIVLLLVLATLIPVGTWGWVWYTARQDQRPASDAIVVLGASQYNGRPSPVFEARLRHAADLYEQGVAPAVVTVGGNQPGDNFTEGGSGGRWLVEAGVPAEQIVAITDGSDTLESMELVALAFEERDWSTAVIVSDPWHSLRSRLIAEDYGMEAATSPARSGPAVLERETQVWYITRETASLWHYWIFGESATVRVDAL